MKMKRIIWLTILFAVAVAFSYGLGYRHALHATGNVLLSSPDSQMVFIGEPQPYRRNITLKPTLGSPTSN